MSTARFLNISGKTKQDATTFVGLHDFEYAIGEPVDAAIILDDPTLTLYCYEPTENQAIFVKTPEDADLTKAPFFYQAQYEHTEKLMAVPYDTFIKLSQKLTLPAKPVIMIHSVGRCGSTLLNQVIDAVPNTVSLSEPDIFSNFLLMRELNGRNDPSIQSLLTASYKFLLKPLPHRPNTSQWAIKYRSSGIEIADLITKAVPNHHNIFLYRNVTDQTRSAIRAFGLKSAPAKKLSGSLLQRWLKLVPMLKKYKWHARWRGFDRIDLNILGWLSRMERYLALSNEGAPICAVRYEDMITEPEKVISALFQVVDLPETAVSQTLHVFQKDSQAGSQLARDKVRTPQNSILSPQNQQKIEKFLKSHPVINTADFELPNTLIIG